MINFIKIIITLWLVTLISYCNAQTHEQIKRALKGSKYKKEIYKVILFETGRLKSKSVKEDNNLFGMQCPQFRETTATACRKNEYTTFAVYDSWHDSIEDFFIWMDYCNKYNNINDFRDFYEWLRANKWNTVNPNYYATLKRLKMDVVVVGRKSRPATIKQNKTK